MSSHNLNDTKSPVVKAPPNYRDALTLRVKKQSFGKSRTSNRDQVTLETEIVAPEEITLDGQAYVLAGQEIKFYLGLSDEKAPKAKASPLAQTKEFHQKLGLSLDLDTDNLPYEGLLFEFYGQTQEKVCQRPDGSGGFEPILGSDGKPTTLGWEWSNYLSNVIGPSAMKVGAPF
jgi:hypothetical protein